MIKRLMLCLCLAVAACSSQSGDQAATPSAESERRVLLTIEFDFNSHRIRPSSYPVLNNVAIALNDERLRGSHFEINGHTDIVGTLGYNLGLSMLRAGAVMDYLAAHGVPNEVMRPQGFGPLQLLDPANPRSGVNRRVEIVALKP
jgi:outer membrane protein OmpA-like peptidoglycan-associated protein